MSQPQVYLHLEQLQDIIANLSGVDRISPAIGFSYDRGDVIQIHTQPPQTAISPDRCPAVIRCVSQLPSTDEAAIDLARLTCDAVFATDTIDRQSVAVLLVETAMIGVVSAVPRKIDCRAFIKQADGSFRKGNVNFIPAHCELYSRSTGLLETDVLENCRVGIVGLGSGGSAIAVELAKAGIGNFVLIDYDRLELANVSRHACGISDLGRYKTNAVKDRLLNINPFVRVETAELDINAHRDRTEELLKECNLIIAATDNDRSRFNLNDIALAYGIPTLFGRALTRAVGGDVLRVRPGGICLGCVFTENFLQSRAEEVSQFKQAREGQPAYVADADVRATVQVGLSSDIMPIVNMMVKLALVELSRGKPSGISSLEDDTIADFYIWANRREGVYQDWAKLEYGSKLPTVLRWYGAKWDRDPLCSVCGSHHRSSAIGASENIFA
jgi:molybdopterin-synthase adenylyltransferase